MFLTSTIWSSRVRGAAPEINVGAKERVRTAKSVLSGFPTKSVGMQTARKPNWCCSVYVVAEVRAKGAGLKAAATKTGARQR